MWLEAAPSGGTSGFLLEGSKVACGGLPRCQLTLRHVLDQIMLEDPLAGVKVRTRKVDVRTPGEKQERVLALVEGGGLMKDKHDI